MPWLCCSFCQGTNSMSSRPSDLVAGHADDCIGDVAQAYRLADGIEAGAEQLVGKAAPDHRLVRAVGQHPALDVPGIGAGIGRGDALDRREDARCAAGNSAAQRNTRADRPDARNARRNRCSRRQASGSRRHPGRTQCPPHRRRACTARSHKDQLGARRTDLRLDRGAAPVPSATMVSTAATPMMMPSMVSRVRNPLRLSEQNRQPDIDRHQREHESLLEAGICVIPISARSPDRDRRRGAQARSRTPHR